MQSPTDSEDALLEWVNEVRKTYEAHEGLCDNFDDLADGQVLLGVMHDFSPSCFPDLRAHSIHLTKLLEGLVAHFRAQPDRGSEGGRLAQRFLEGCVQGAGCPEVGRLLQLVIWATLDPEHHEYIAVCEELRQRNPSFENALKEIIEHFNPAPSKPVDADADFIGHTLGEVCTAEPSEDFLNLAVDIQIRFNWLMQAYHRVMHERESEREQWHRVASEREQEREQWQIRLRAAEEAQREAREGLDAAHEDQHKVQEDQRSLLEQRHEKALRRRNEEIADLRERLDSIQKQAEKAGRLELQLADARKKIEDLREQQKESGELTARLERQQLEGPDLGALEHQRGRLEKMQSHLEAVVEEREEEQKQVQMLQFELGDERNAREEAADEASRYRRELVELAAASSSGQVAHTTSAAVAAAVARQSPLAGPHAGPHAGPQSGEALAEAPLSGAGGEIQRLYRQWLDEKDRGLLEEKERTRIAEADLQAQRAESLKLAEKRAGDEARAAALEERLRSQASQLQELRDLHGTPGPTPRAPGALGGAEQALHAQLAQRERELQVFLHRGQVDAQHLAVQEGLMASSFHALGLRYHRVLAQREQLLHRVRDLEQRSSSGSA